MKVGRLCKHQPVTTSATTDLVAAAELMRKEHIGYIIVVDLDPPKPVGVLTDRDIVVSVVAKGADPKALRVGDVMSAQPVTVNTQESVRNALQTMRRMGIRRVPVVGAQGELVGVLALDDVLDEIAREMADVTGTMQNEQRIEHVLRL